VRVKRVAKKTTSHPWSRREMNSPGYKPTPDTSGWLNGRESVKTGFIR
jgi:hypothetical protein